tara:strand:- start:1725 stop:2657 length:933 start_codon:yes stop_codon:yes gene_type:complete
VKNFINIDLVSKKCLKTIIKDAKQFKYSRIGLRNGAADKRRFLENSIVGLIFEKPSTRTRVSFDVGIRQMGGKTMVLSANNLQLGNGETIQDTAKILSLYLDMLLVRTSDENKLLELAAHASVPVINGLTDNSHPCQVMADIMTFEELKGSIKGKKVVWVGDGNNVCASYIHAAVQFDFGLTIAAPIEFSPDKQLVAWAKKCGAEVVVVMDVNKAVDGADLVVTDTHLSMHNDLSEAKRRLEILRSYQVNEELMSKAKHDAIFMHCLPAHRNVEVSEGVIDGSQSVVFQEAENRLHVQKAIMKWCFDKID